MGIEREYRQNPEIKPIIQKEMILIFTFLNPRISSIKKQIRRLKSINKLILNPKEAIPTPRTKLKRVYRKILDLPIKKALVFKRTTQLLY